jgi:ubiquitin-conjugating enzyme E2 variant
MSVAYLRQPFVLLLTKFVVPRTFRLYEELEKAEHAQLSDQSVSYGLDKGDDQSFTQWNGTIVGPPSTVFDNRIYFLLIECGPNYPMIAPIVRFTSKVNLPSVNQSNGLVEPNKFPLFRNWQKETNMEKILIGLKQEMIANKSAKQPADGDFF